MWPGGRKEWRQVIWSDDTNIIWFWGTKSPSRMCGSRNAKDEFDQV